MNKKNYFLELIVCLIISAATFNQSVIAETGGFIIQRKTLQVNRKIYTKTNKHVAHKNLTPEKMKQLYNSDLYKTFYDVLKLKGFDEYYIPRLFCIAKMESSFNAAAVNSNRNGTFDVGLFQINSVWQKECKFNNKLHYVEVNIDCAKKIVEKRGLRPWVTYNRFGHICEDSLKI